MQNLKVSNEDDWEEICRYLMANVVYKNTGEIVNYERYGKRGERQHGVDLIPVHSDNGLYAQCKHKNTGTLTSDEVFADLHKTSLFPKTIKRYFVFTTSDRHTSIQNQFVNRETPYVHKNSGNLDGFRVQIFYWKDVKTLSWLPEEVQRQYFPVLFQNSYTNNVSMHDSIIALKNVIPKFLSNSNVEWLESWGFRNNKYIFEQDYDPFCDLYLEYYRAKLSNNSIEILAEGDRAELFRAIPAGNKIFNALEEFYNHIQNEMIASLYFDKQNILVIEGDLIHVTNYLITLNQLAINLATELRTYIFPKPTF